MVTSCSGTAGQMAPPPLLLAGALQLVINRNPYRAVLTFNTPSTDCSNYRPTDGRAVALEVLLTSDERRDRVRSSQIGGGAGRRMMSAVAIITLTLYPPQLVALWCAVGRECKPATLRRCILTSPTTARPLPAS